MTRPALWKWITIALLLGACGHGKHLDPPPPEFSSSGWTLRTIARGDGPDGVDLFDIDRDGDLDVVVGYEQADRVVLYLNPGDPSVRQQWPAVDVRGGIQLTDFEMAIGADFDDNGRVDAIVSACEGDEKKIAIHWLIDPANPGNADAWSSMTLLPERREFYMAVHVAQIDGRGARDIVAGSKTKDDKHGRIFWFRAPPDPSNALEWERYTIGESRRTLSLQIVDMNGDGDLDVLFSDNRDIAWFEHPGEDRVTGRWQKHVIDAKRRPRMLTLCDVDGDGSLDVLSTTNDEADHGVVGRWYRRLDDTGLSWQGFDIAVAGGLPYGVQPMHKSYSKAAGCGDLDGDGRVDLVFAARGSAQAIFRLSRPAGAPATSAEWLPQFLGPPMSAKYDNLAIRDLDGDGDLDVITTEESDGLFGRGLGVVWYENSLH